jgi:hypothetical protein
MRRVAIATTQRLTRPHSAYRPRATAGAGRAISAASPLYVATRRGCARGHPPPLIAVARRFHASHPVGDAALDRPLLAERLLGQAHASRRHLPHTRTPPGTPAPRSRATASLPPGLVTAPASLPHPHLSVHAPHHGRPNATIRVRHATRCNARCRRCGHIFTPHLWLQPLGARSARWPQLRYAHSLALSSRAAQSGRALALLPAGSARPAGDQELRQPRGTRVCCAVRPTYQHGLSPSARTRCLERRSASPHVMIEDSCRSREAPRVLQTRDAEDGDTCV